MSRPDFKEIKSYAEFEKHYWYREELQDICKSLGLEYNANKTELNKIIKEYFFGNKITHKPKVVVTTRIEQLTLDTSLIECGFSFSNRFRDFYSLVTGEKNFKFTADMVATVRAVKENKDKNFTLGNLLDIKTGKKQYVKFDNSACQWNRFLKDFCADENNNCYKDKLKVASKFWQYLEKVTCQRFTQKNLLRKIKT